MKMKTHAVYAFCAILAASFFIASCTIPLADKPKVKKNNGVVTLTLSGATSTGSDSGRTIVPGTSDIAMTTYDVVLSRSDYADKTATFTSPTLTGDIEDIEVGEWIIVVNGKTSGGSIIASGSSTVTVASPGPTAAAVSLSYTTADETNPGSINITLLFPKSVGITAGTAGVEATLDGVAISPALTVADNGDSNNKVVYSVSNITVASPLLRIKLKKGSADMIFWAERVWVYKNITTTKTCTLASTDFGAVPPAPASLTAVLQANNSVALSWPHVNIAENYILERSSNAGGLWAVLASSIAAGTTSRIDSTVSSGTTYIYRISATNSYGSSSYATSGQVVLVGIPGTPTVIVGSSQLSLSWTAVSGATAYEVWYGTSSSSGASAKFGGDVAITSVVITALANGTPYYVWLKAKNATGTSGFSSTVCRTPCASWSTVGIAGFSTSRADYAQLAVDTDGTLYAVYQENSTKATVMKFNGIAWVTVGSAGFSAGIATYTSLAIHPTTKQPYVVFRDAANSEKATVMRFDGTAWVLVGTAGFNVGGTMLYTSIAFSPSGIPYVAYKESLSPSGVKVMKFNGTAWVLAGTTGNASPSTADWPYLAFGPSETPWVVYRISEKATVSKLIGNDWTVVGTASFSAGSALYPCLAFDSVGTPYVSYKDVGNGSKATVLKFNGTAWVAVGNVGFSSSYVERTGLAFNSANMPYITFQDLANSFKATVMKFNGSNWELVGSVGFSAGGTNFISIVMYADIPYVLYGDSSLSSRATVMKFQ